MFEDMGKASLSGGQWDKLSDVQMQISRELSSVGGARGETVCKKVE
jgi:hypothetical protein